MVLFEGQMSSWAPLNNCHKHPGIKAVTGCFICPGRHVWLPVILGLSLLEGSTCAHCTLNDTIKRQSGLRQRLESYSLAPRSRSHRLATVTTLNLNGCENSDHMRHRRPLSPPPTPSAPVITLSPGSLRTRSTPSLHSR